MIRADTCIAQFAALEAYVWVEVVRPDKVIHLLGRTRSDTTLCGSSKDHQTQRVLRSKLLLEREKVAPRIVKLSLHIGVITPTARGTRRDRPSLGHHTRGVRYHRAVVVGAVAP